MQKYLFPGHLCVVAVVECNVIVIDGQAARFQHNSIFSYTWKQCCFPPPAPLLGSWVKLPWQHRISCPRKGPIFASWNAQHIGRRCLRIPRSWLRCRDKPDIYMQIKGLLGCFGAHSSTMNKLHVHGSGAVQAWQQVSQLANGVLCQQPNQLLLLAPCSESGQLLLLVPHLQSWF